MKTRIKFTKSGPLKFVGHLDVMRFFQKVFRRADIEVELSNGFSPHQIISFASPLGVGLTSDGEYVDVTMATCDDKETMISRMNDVMNEYITVVDFTILDDNSKNCMSIVAGADYMCSLRDGFDFISKEEFVVKFNEFMQQDTIIAMKKSKRTEGEIDIKPFIYRYSVDKFDNLPYPSVADVYENGITACVQLATGSVNNIKPEIVMESFCKYIGVEFQQFMFQYHRIEVYYNKGTEEMRELVPLSM